MASSTVFGATTASPTKASWHRATQRAWAVLLISILLAIIPTTSSAQSASGDWSAPLNLFATTGRASEVEVVSDPSGTVHVFWAYEAPEAEESGSHQAIYHTSHTDGFWSSAVDVLVSPGDRVARMHSVVSDEGGYLHIAWSGGNGIYYSRAYAPKAGSAQGWSPPTSLVSGVNALEPDIATNGKNNLCVVWSQARAGLMLARSDDGGKNWSQPQPAFLATSDTELARWGRVAVDEAGRLHMVLTHTIRDPDVSPEREDPNFLYYLRSDDGGDTWTEPYLVVDSPDFGEVNVATFGGDVVHLAWNGRAGRHGRYHRWSADGGQTWSAISEVVAPAPESAIGTGGLTGFPAIVVDATGVLHLVSATGGGDYYFRWAEGQWSAPVLISPGLDGAGVTGISRSLEQPSVALSEGNLLHAVFHDGFQRIWHTMQQVDAPHEEPRLLPTAAPDATITPTSPSPPGPTATSPTSVSTPSSDTAATAGSGQARLFAVALGTTLALIIVVATVLINRGHTGRR